MLTLLIVFIALGIIMEVVSLRRDPDLVELEFDISTLRAEPGETFQIITSVSNNSRVPLSYLSVLETYPLTAVIPDNIIFKIRQDDVHIRKFCRVKGRDRKKLTFSTSILKRGVHVFTGDSVEFGDFLGFREYTKRVYLRRELVVYPERLVSQDLSDALGRFFGELAARRFLIRDPILTIGCREYTGREPMKEIHWLQSAHRNELMVREFDYNRQLTACVILGVDKIDADDEDGLDDCCSAARTICETLIESGVSVNFYTNSLLKRIHENALWKCEASAGHTSRLLESLGRVTCYSRGSLPGLLEYADKDSDFDAAFIVILPSSDERGADAIELLKRQTGREAMLINMGQSAAGRAAAQRDSEEGQSDRTA